MSLNIVEHAIIYTSTMEFITSLDDNETSDLLDNESKDWCHLDWWWTALCATIKTSF